MKRSATETSVDPRIASPTTPSETMPPVEESHAARLEGGGAPMKDVMSRQVPSYSQVSAAPPPVSTIICRSGSQLSEAPARGDGEVVVTACCQPDADNSQVSCSAAAS